MALLTADAERDVEARARRRAAGGEREVLVHHEKGVVAREDADHTVRLEHGVRQERAASVALEPEGRGAARPAAGLLQPERV